MSNSVDPTTGAPNADHLCPAWCDPQLCVSDPEGRQHYSSPQILKVGNDGELTVRLTQYVQHHLPDEPGTVNIEIFSATRTFKDFDCDLQLPIAEIGEVASAITEMTWRARLLSTPTVRSSAP